MEAIAVGHGDLVLGRGSNSKYVLSRSKEGGCYTSNEAGPFVIEAATIYSNLRLMLVLRDGRRSSHAIGGFDENAILTMQLSLTLSHNPLFCTSITVAKQFLNASTSQALAKRRSRSRSGQRYEGTRKSGGTSGETYEQ